MLHGFPYRASAIILIVFGATAAVGACDGNPVDTSTDVRSAPNAIEAAAAAEGQGEFRAPMSALPFDIAQVFFEFNTTDNDLGLQVFLDAEDWRRVRVNDADGKSIVDISTAHGLTELGITELRFESAEPSPAEVLDLFAPGQYTFTGRTVDGAWLKSDAVLSHQFAAAPDFSPSDGETVDPTATVVSWSSPGAVQVEIIIESEFDGSVLDVIVDASITSLDVPPQFLTPGTDYKIEILAVAANGNRTIAESTFVTS